MLLEFRTAQGQQITTNHSNYVPRIGERVRLKEYPLDKHYSCIIEKVEWNFTQNPTRVVLTVREN